MGLSIRVWQGVENTVSQNTVISHFCKNALKSEYGEHMYISFI